MKKKKSRTLISDFLNNTGLSRRSFIKRTAVTGAAVTLGSGMMPEMKALAAAAKTSGKAQGKWFPATCIPIPNFTGPHPIQFRNSFRNFQASITLKPVYWRHTRIDKWSNFCKAQ